MAEVPFRPARQLSEYKGKGASASREGRYQTEKSIKKYDPGGGLGLFTSLCHHF